MRMVEATYQLKSGNPHSPRSIVLDPMQAFELWAGVYDDSPNPIIQRSERAIVEGLPDIEGLTVADLACGTGRLLAQLLRLAPKTCVGLDLSHAMLEKARLKGETAGSLIQADLYELPILSGSMDWVTFSLGLSYCRNLTQVAQEVQRILKPGGRVLCTDFHPTASELGWKRSFKIGSKHYEVSHHPHSIQDILQAFSTHYQLISNLDLYFGEPERALFEAAGKSSWFEEFRSQAALLLFEWQKPAGTIRTCLKKLQDLSPTPIQWPTSFPDGRTRSLFLWGGKVAFNALEVSETDLQIDCGIITAMNSSQVKPEPYSTGFLPINLQGYLVLPGLINAHDHLEFGLFPRLGDGPYPDAKSWALDIYRPQKSPIRELLKVTKPTRLFWGALKNLLSGVTTVCHHNPYDEGTFRTHFPVRVLDSYRWAHSLDFFSAIQQSLKHLPRQAPFQIHLGEGIGERSRLEIYELEKKGLLNKHSVLVHGVAFGKNEWKLIRKRGASVVWCPSSNLFTLGTTLNLDSLSKEIPVALGNDSPLTAEGDLLDEIRLAAQLGTTPEKLYAMVTEIPARILQLQQGEGRIKLGGIADLLIVTDTGELPAQRLLSLRHRDIQLMIRGGEIVLASEQFLRRSATMLSDTLQPIFFDELKWWTSLDVLSRWNETSRILGADVMLAGRSVRV